MNRAVTHIGDGKPARVLREFRRGWPGLEVTFRSDDISRPTDWRIRDRRHAVVVHLGGVMKRLETELNGFGGSTGPACPGEIWTAPAGCDYASHANGDRIHYAVMFVDPGVLDTMTCGTSGSLELAPRAGVRDDFLHQAVRKLMEIAEAEDDVSQMFAESVVRTIILHLGLNHSPGESTPARRASGPELDAAIIRRLRDFIYDNLGNRIGLEELSLLSGMKTHQLLIAFRKAFGTTPGQYIIQQRLRCARRLLLETKKDITSIALDTGFSSHSHLTDCFRRHFGCPPTAVRSNEKLIG